MKEFEEMLPEKLFCRIHNSYLVNIAHIDKLQKGRGGSVIMKDGTTLEIAFRRKDTLQKLFIH